MDINDGDILTQIINFTLTTGDDLQNKFTWKYSGNPHSDVGIISALDGWAEDFYELMAAYLGSGITAFTAEYNLIEWDSETSEWVIAENIGTGGGTVTFTGTGHLLPFQCCPCLVGFTDRPKTRGRKFIPLFVELAQIDSTWEAAAYTAIAAALAEYLSSHTIETGKSVLPGVASTITGTFHQFLSGMVKNIVFTQRRRTKGRGE